MAHAAINAGSVLIFNANCSHRGTANISSVERPILVLDTSPPCDSEPISQWVLYDYIPPKGTEAGAVCQVTASTSASSSSSSSAAAAGDCGGAPDRTPTTAAANGSPAAAATAATPEE